ncbi:MAG: cation:proton antiporter [Fimbriimonadaceae bacterium]|nr:cation:proton antiporter [Fimbriimonadaceae bacterium]
MPLPIAAVEGNVLAGTLALLGVVLLIAALFSGLIERSRTPQVALFLALGAAIGPFGLNQMDVGLKDESLRIVATLSLALILFTEALTLDLREVRANARLALLILGPGTLLAMLMIAFAANFFLKLSWPLSLMLGAALASTDPVLLRSLLRWRGLPRDTRLALRLESGLNDVVLLPVIMVAIASSLAATSDNNVPRTLMRVIVLGPFAGIMVGLVGVATLTLIRKLVGVRRDYESLYSLGVCFVSFGVAEALQSSGFVAAFAAGAVIAALDIELCDCFKEYGETTAELAMLFTFVLLGVSLAWQGLYIPSWQHLVVVLLALCARPIALLLALLPTPMTPESRGLLAWFGPRGLSSILMVLIPVFSGVPGSEDLFHVCATVMLFSIVIHGGSVMWLDKRHGEKAQADKSGGDKSGADGAHGRPLTPVPQIATASIPGALRAGLATGSGALGWTLDDYEAHRAAGETIRLLDVRSAASFNASPDEIPGSFRSVPKEVVETVEDLGFGKDETLVAFCTCANEETSNYVTELLRAAGYTNAYALIGGWQAWVDSGRPTQPKQALV